jgi:hypothetical protein
MRPGTASSCGQGTVADRLGLWRWAEEGFAVAAAEQEDEAFQVVTQLLWRVNVSARSTRTDDAEAWQVWPIVGCRVVVI